MSKIDLAAAVAECRAATSFLVTTHAGPDGDAIGSALGVRYFLEALGKSDITCACQDSVPLVYRWMRGADEIVNADAMRDAYDLVIIIDVAQRERIGTIGAAIGADQRVMVLDHHREENPCGTVNFVDYTYASASEIVAGLFDAAEMPMTLAAAECIYVGLTTDTGSFRYGNTNPRAFRTAAALQEAGVDTADISARVFDVMSPAKAELLQRVLEHREVSDCGRFAWTYLTEADLEEAHALPEDSDGLVNYMLNLQGMEVGMLFRELAPAKVKVSVRSRGSVDASAALRPLGGGGHAGAAGAVIESAMDAAQAMVLERIQETLGAIPSQS